MSNNNMRRLETGARIIGTWLPKVQLMGINDVTLILLIAVANMAM
jgi:hypothetical protein